MKKNGFTLIEVTAVIAILAIIALLVVPKVSKLIGESKDKSYISLVETLNDAAKSYAYMNAASIDQEIISNGYASVTILTLKEEGLLKVDLKNPRTNNLVSNIDNVRITKSGNIYSYEYIDTDTEYVSDGLILWYDAINNSENGHSSNSTTWYDLSGNENNGTLSNFDMIATSGWNSDYLKFDGADDYIQIPTLSSGLPKTYEFVFSAENMSTSQIIFADYTNRIGFGIYSQGYMTALTTDYTSALFNINQSANTFYNTSLIANSTTSKILKINNTIVPSNANTNNWAYSDTNSYIGKRSSGTFFKGSLKSFRVYDRALTNKEIKHNYEIDKARFGVE